MKPTLVLAVAILLASGAAPLAAAPARPDTLRAFGSDAELRAFLRTSLPAVRREGVVALQSMEVTGAAAAPSAPPSVTNVQHAGVDEGGIVKVHGEHLVILRRGRLFTVAVGDDRLSPVSALDAFGPGIDPGRTWYDELLISGNVVVVIGFSYERGGTEIGVFEIDRGGRLGHRATYQLRSDDYYSSRNYASRLIGSRLVFYAPLHLYHGVGDPLEQLPAFRRWEADGGRGEFRRILSARRIYHAGLPERMHGPATLHSVLSCDLARAEVSCDATAVLGPPGRVFYVSPGSVYVWTASRTPSAPGHRDASMLYRIPLAGAAPSAIGVQGSPVDQFSFLEGADGHLNVLVRSEGRGEGMWDAERPGGEVSLLRLPLRAIGDGSGRAAPDRYRPLPAPRGWAFQNRFVGTHLLYGTGSGWGRPREREDGSLYVVPITGGSVARLPLSHGVDRIEALGEHAVVVGAAAGDLHFSSVRLGRAPSVVDRYVRPDASQGELRSHGFFYRADDPAGGVLGLPIRGGGRPGFDHLRHGSASVLFLRTRSLRFEEIGQLASGDAAAGDDACRASCVDWYGNARPLFLGGRILALLGYEIVEGGISGDRLRELRRVDFTPRRGVASR
jgi:hypothetical protein